MLALLAVVKKNRRSLRSQSLKKKSALASLAVVKKIRRSLRSQSFSKFRRSLHSQSFEKLGARFARSQIGAHFACSHLTNSKLALLAMIKKRVPNLCNDSERTERIISLTASGESAKVFK